MHVLVLAGVVRQTVAQRHETLGETFVDGVTPSGYSNRARAQHWKTHTTTHTHTEKMN